jgi:UDP-3-O-[3-hydroxymyristoyl] glucosamine N-acyltransferase
VIRLPTPETLDSLLENSLKLAKERLNSVVIPGELPPIAAEIKGEKGLFIHYLATCQEKMEKGSLCFAEKAAFLREAITGGAAAVITTEELASETQGEAFGEGSKVTFIVTPFPRLLFVAFLDYLEPKIRPFYAAAEPYFKDKDSTDIHPTVSFGPFCYVGAHVTIGAGTIVGPRVTIEDGCQIGEGCHIHPGAILRWGVTIGSGCQIHCGAVIGDDGFGYTQIPLNKQGRIHHYKNPHLGGVRLGDNVEVGALCAVDRGLADDTVIESGTKLDNLVQVGHNCKIGHDCILVSQVAVGGHSTVGDRVFLLGQAGLSHGVTVGDDAKVTGQTGVTGKIPPGDKLWSGTPCVPMDEDLKVQALSRRYLPQLKKLLAAMKKSGTFLEMKELLNSEEKK